MIQLVLFLSYASSEELGYDKTMRLFEGKKYEVNVGSLTFVSSRILFDLAADRLCGRATRVFEVYEKLGPLQHFALKDQWINDDRLAEGSVLEDLRATIKSEMKKGLFDDMDLTRVPVDYFLSVKAYSHVQLSNTFEDNTKTIMQGLSLPDSSSSLSIPFSEKNFVSSNVPGVNSESAGHIPYPSPSIASILPIKRSNLHPRRHDRTVFNEVGTPLHDLDNLSDLFRGLADVTIGKISVDFVLNILLTSDLTLALEIIHRLKCVHRDISTGNILLYQGVGRLSDLEFLKELSSLQSHEVKTVCLHASLLASSPI
jgi:Fungal protein kinase